MPCPFHSILQPSFAKRELNIDASSESQSASQAWLSHQGLETDWSKAELG